jgi:hypothetical protein
MADEREPPSADQIGTVIRLLSQEHAERAAERDAERAWGRIESSIPRVAPNRAVKGGAGRLFAIAAGLAAAACVFLAFRADSQLSYELRGASARGGVIEAERGEATVSLSDGSSILAENRSKFSVDVVGRNAALTRLVSGRLHVKVEHNEDTSYRFLAGPYEVRVVGTEFHLAWDPAGSGLSLAMSKGEVRLSEPGGKLRTLRAGESVQLPSPIAEAPVAVAPSARPQVEVAVPVQPPTDAAPVDRASSAPSQRDAAVFTSWDALVAKGQFADVVREAETLGVDSVTATRGPSDLKALGQAARYVGKRALALRAFTALRQRSRDSDSARQAAFFLARLQEEQGNQAEALSWLDTYIKESPRGVYAAEAYGRRLSLSERLRGKAATVALAREYLERFPEGAYAQRARGIVEPR